MYRVYYIENCTAKLKSFSDILEMYQFVTKFQMDSLDNPDNFIEFIFEGKLLHSNLEEKDESQD